jgi:predicted dehydrogenase
MQKDRSPSIALIGCGYWGKNLVRNFSKLNALALCCDATPAGRATAAELAPQATVVSDIHDALESEVDGVVIATPAETHYELARGGPRSGQGRFRRKASGADL